MAASRMGGRVDFSLAPLNAIRLIAFEQDGKSRIVRPRVGALFESAFLQAMNKRTVIKT